MNSFSKRLILLGLAIFGFSSFALALSQAVTYKPWGVPDSRRDEYDQRMVQINRQAQLQEKYAGMPRPVAVATPSSHDFGPVYPGESLSCAFTIANKGNDELKLKIRETSSDRLGASLDVDSVPPGESIDCAITLAAPEDLQANIDVQSVTIQTNDPLRPVLVLRTALTLREEIVAPQQIRFGNHDLAESATAEFVVYSQRGSKLELLNVFNDDFDIESAAAEADTLTGELAGKSATVAKRITVEIEANDYGKYSGTLDLSFDLDGEIRQVSLPFSGVVRPPIGFYGPNIDKRTGLDFGTVENDKQHDLFVVVRSRADQARPIEVLAVEPKELEAELTPLETEGSYRLRVSIPKGCPYRRFNLSTQHGYVHVGDPKLKSYSGTLPVFGVVGDFQKD